VTVVVVPEPVVVVENVCPVDVIASTEAVISVLTKSNSNIWFLTGTISNESGITLTLICEDATPSISEILKILIGNKLTIPVW